MLSLSDPQLKSVMAAAGLVALERRAIFLQRVGAMLKLRGRSVPCIYIDWWIGTRPAGSSVHLCFRRASLYPGVELRSMRVQTSRF
jgi:hypothetical protein